MTRRQRHKTERQQLKAELAEAANIERRLRGRIERLERENRNLQKNLAAVARAAREAGAGSLVKA